jgi:hypothetical protein
MPDCHPAWADQNQTGSAVVPEDLIVFFMAGIDKKNPPTAH